MSELDHSLAAPLVRGLYLGAAGRPLVIVPGDANRAGRGALRVELGGSGPPSAGGLAESPASVEAAWAASLAAAFAAWRASAPRRTGSAQGRADALPPCVLLSRDGASAAYWPGLDLDEAIAGAARAEDAPWEAPRSSPGRAEPVSGRVALVTGGAQGFGEEIVRGLVASGATVFIADRNTAGAERLALALNDEAGGLRAIALAMDVADEGSVRAAFAEAASRAGGLDLVVSNAGVLKAGSVLEQEADAFRFVTEVNYTGFFLVAKQAALAMRRQRRLAPRWATDIVQINSKSGLQGSNRNGAYAGSKFGGLGLVQSFALELVEQGTKVNAICPGNFFDGPLWADPESGLFVQYLRSGKVPGARSVAEVKAFYEAKVPMGRGCEGRDVMRALFYLVEQEYETGQALPVTGGQVMLN